MNNHKWVCVPCREVFKGKGNATCPRCHESMKYMGYRWRPPKKNNDRAWKRLEKEDWFWDKNAISRRAESEQVKSFEREERSKERRKDAYKQLINLNRVLSMEDLAFILNVEIRQLDRWARATKVFGIMYQLKIKDLHKALELGYDFKSLKETKQQLWASGIEGEWPNCRRVSFVRRLGLTDQDSFTY